MGSRGSKADYDLSPEDFSLIQRETGFSKAQVRRLFLRFKHLDKGGKGFLVKGDLLRIKEVFDIIIKIIIIKAEKV